IRSSPPCLMRTRTFSRRGFMHALHSLSGCSRPRISFFLSRCFVYIYIFLTFILIACLVFSVSLLHIALSHPSHLRYPYIFQHPSLCSYRIAIVSRLHFHFPRFSAIVSSCIALGYPSISCYSVSLSCSVYIVLVQIASVVVLACVLP
ncbi:hypothetical protein CPB85DRAFT_1312055, partial [Mucidula mucida]